MAEDTRFPNRETQLQILQQLFSVYPGGVVVKEMTYPNLDPELQYLMEHGLVNVHNYTAMGESKPTYTYAKITAKGVDFLEGDGGLSAILGVVTIKLHDDTIKSLIEAKIMQSDLPQPDKRRYLDALRELPAETTKHLVLKLVDMGLDHKDAAISVIGKWILGG